MILILAPAFAGTWKELVGSDATASSWLISDWNKYEENYHPNYAFDDDPATAWVEGEEGTGVGARLSWNVSYTSAVKYRISIRSGYQKSESLLAANAAPTRIRLEAGNEQLGEFTLTNTSGWQSFEFRPRDGTLTELRLTVLEARAGKKYADLCISDIRVEAEDPKDYSPALQDALRASLKAWKAERVQTARTMATVGADYPWGSTRFTSTDTELKKAEAVALLAVARGHLLAIMRAPTPWQKRTVARRWPVPDGLTLPNNVDVRLEDATYVEAEAELAGQGTGAPSWAPTTIAALYHGWWASNVRMYRTDGKGTFVYHWQRTIVEERGTYDTTEQTLSWYDPEGRLGWTYTHIGADAEMLRTYTWTGGRITAEDRINANDGVWSEYGDEQEYAVRTRSTAR